MLFAGFVSAYLVLRGSLPSWPPAGQPRFPLWLVSLNTLVLLGSGYAMWRATRSGEPVRRRAWLRWALGLGAVFLVVQGIEWARLVSYGFLADAGPYGGIFYTLVGTHALHALGGLVVLAWVARPLELSRGRLQASALYWGFVVTLWPLLYVLVFVL
jgi:heme/copper-type cytochrome/quinol oxidase subunit 3